METIFNSIFLQNKFKPEVEEGNIEYKWRLDLKDNFGIKKLVSQMVWRLNEGYDVNGVYEAHYLLGVYDSGEPGNLTINELIATKEIFNEVIIKAKVEIIKEKMITINESSIVFITIRKIPQNKKLNELNVLFIGDSDTGKTTTIGNICYNNNDQNPIYRDSILLHSHEKINGKTTAYKKDIVGIKKSSLITYTYSTNWGEIAATSDIIINLYDTPGSKIKNSLHCLSSINFDFVFHFQHNINNNGFDVFIKQYLEIKKIPHKIVFKDKINYDEIRSQLIVINKLTNIEYISHFKILSTYGIPDNINIVGGIQIWGAIKRNLNYKLIGSYDNFCELPIKILTIHKKNTNSSKIEQGESGTLSFDFIDKKIQKLNKNMIIIPDDVELKYHYNSIKIEMIYKNKLNDNRFYIVYTGNFCFRAELVENELKFDKSIYLLDSVLILIPINCESKSIPDNLCIYKLKNNI